KRASPKAGCRQESVPPAGAVPPSVSAYRRFPCRSPIFMIRSEILDQFIIPHPAADCHDFTIYSSYIAFYRPRPVFQMFFEKPASFMELDFCLKSSWFIAWVRDRKT